MIIHSHILHRIVNRFRWVLWGEVFVFSLGVGMASFGLSKSLKYPPSPLYISLLAACTCLIILVIKKKLLRLNEQRVAIYLNNNYPALQNSADLLLKLNEKLSSLEILQKEKVRIVLQTEERYVRAPHQLPAAFLVLLAGAVTCLLPQSATFSTPFTPTANEPAAKLTPLDSCSFPAIENILITSTSPRYTQLPSTTTTGFALKGVEGTLFKWNIDFTNRVDEVKLILSAKDTFNTTVPGRTVTFQKNIHQSGFYQIMWKKDDSVRVTDFFPIEITRDAAPTIAIQNLTQFTEVKLSGPLSINIPAELSDDFGLTDAFITATVSKGSGESVKFREEKIRFSKPSQIGGKHSNALRTIDLYQLGLEAGDELYFYIEAYDNRVPTANKSRTETYFIVLQDTTQQETVSDDGLGVDLMPEYFRSQRQIIIDTEKLLAEKNKNTKAYFNATSNELGYDQKVLRLRYGQFMGEEFETTIGPAENETAHEEEHEEDVTKAYGHQHDTENEHHLVSEKKPDEHTHVPGEKEDPLEQFAHEHDDAEEATFFIQSIKAKLRAALTLMWDAELYLRMYQPQASLPYQYKILKLLKEISNDSRIYVKRTGFDPPPLKEEKRLSGDLTALKNSATKTTVLSQSHYPAIRQAISILAPITQPTTLSKAEKIILQKASVELATVALENPSYLKALSTIKHLTETEIATREESIFVVKSIYRLIPEGTITPTQQMSTTHTWEKLFIHRTEKDEENE